VADKEVTLPIIISEGEEEAGSSHDAQANLSHRLLVSPHLKAVTVSKLKLKKPSVKVKVTKLVKEATPLLVNKDEKRATTPELEDWLKKEREKKEKKEKRATTPELKDWPKDWPKEEREKEKRATTPELEDWPKEEREKDGKSAHRDERNLPRYRTLLGQRFVVARKGVASRSRPGTVASDKKSSYRESMDDIQATPPLACNAATSLEIGESKRNQAVAISKAKKNKSSEKEKKPSRKLSPQPEGGVSDRGVAALPLQKKKPFADTNETTSGAMATMESSGTPCQPSVSNGEDKTVASMSSSSSESSPVRKLEGHSQNNSSRAPDSGSPVLLQQTVTPTGTARTHLFNFSSRKKPRVTVHGCNQQQLVGKNPGASPSNTSASEAEQVVPRKESSTVVAGRKRPLSKIPSREEVAEGVALGNHSFTEFKKEKIMDSSPSNKKSVGYPEVVQKVTVSKPKVTFPVSSDSNRKGLYSLPLFFAPKGKAPEDYSKTILKGLDQYISLLADAQSKVMSRIKWGDPITIIPKRSKDTLRRSSSINESQTWKYSLPLRSGLCSSADIVEPHQPSKSNESDAFATRKKKENNSAALEMSDREDCAVVTMSEGSPGSQDGGRSSSEEKFIPLVSYHEESDNEQDSNHHVIEEGSSPRSERSLRSGSSNRIIDQDTCARFSSGGMAQGNPQVDIPQDNPEPMVSSTSNTDLFPVDTEETCLGDFHVPMVGAASSSTEESKSSGKASSPQPISITRSSNQNRGVRKRQLQELESSTASEDELDISKKERSSWLDARSSVCSVSTPLAKRARVAEHTSSSEEEVRGGKSTRRLASNRSSSLCGSTPSVGRKRVSRVLSSSRTDRNTVKVSEQRQQRGKITSAAARLLLSAKGKQGVVDASQDKGEGSPYREDSHFASKKGPKKKPPYNPCQWQSSNSDSDTHSEEPNSPPSSSKPPRKQSKLSPILPSSSDSDFSELAKFAESTKQKSEGLVFVLQLAYRRVR